MERAAKTFYMFIGFFSGYIVSLGFYLMLSMIGFRVSYIFTSTMLFLVVVVYSMRQVREMLRKGEISIGTKIRRGGR